MKRLLAHILVIILAFSFISCSEIKDLNSGSNSAVSESSGNVSHDALAQDESYKDILSEDDDLLMTTDINGTKRYICINEKMNRDFDTSNAKFEKYDFAVLTDMNQTIKPTLVRKGDTFMNWKLAEVSAGFYCFDDGRMYPTSNISIKLEGDIAFEAPFYYSFYDGYNKEVINIYPEVKDYELFPYPVYTHPVYSPSYLKQSDFKFEFEVQNVSEMAEKYNLKYGNYNGNVKVKSFSINYYQPGGGHYCEGEVDSIRFSNEKLKTDSSKGEAYNTAITAYNDFLNGKANAVSRDGKQNFTINNIGNSAGDPSIISYALYDVTGDGVPELHTRSLNYYIFSYQNKKVVLLLKDTLNFWLPEEFPPDEGGQIGDGSAAVLENRAVFSYTVNENGRKYAYTTFDSDGKPTTLNFTDPTQYFGQEVPAGAYYTFDNKKVTKDEFESKTREILAMKKVELEWKNYVK